MNDFRALPPPAEFNVAPSAAGAPEPQENPFEIFHRVHRLLRGRYIYAIVFGTIGAVAGAVIGFKSTVPKYQAVGMIRVKTPKPLVYQLQDMQSSNGYVRSIAQLLQEPRVFDRAMQSDEWKQFQRGLSDDAKDEFRESLRVETDPGANEWIYVKFNDADPKAAKVGAEQVIRAYTDLHGSEDTVITDEGIEQLALKVKKYDVDIRLLQEQINAIGTPFGTTDLEGLYKEGMEEFRNLDRQHGQLKAQIEFAESAPAEPEAEPKPAEPDLDAIAADMAKTDEVMRALTVRFADAQSYLDLLVARGFTEEHPSVRKQRAIVQGLQTQVHTLATKRLEQAGGVVANVAGAQIRLSPEQLKSAKLYLESLSKRRDAIRDRVAELNRERLRIAELSDQVKKTQGTKADFERRLTQLTTESLGGTTTLDPRIKVISYGEEPHRPYSDSRRKLAAFGILLGGGFPLGLILLWGLLDRRYRYSDDASSGAVHPTLLGILPYLPDDMSDPEQAAIAAHCVHQIRTLLQISAAQMGKRVFAITSPTSGDGKTSLSMSLALSFASSGANTCIIDFDLIGCGLTSAMNAKSEVGLMHAVSQAELNGQIRQTGFNRLSIVPAGTHDAALVATLSPESVRRIIKQARDKFDVVIIDTGPILGSLEASLVTSAADGVILALGRGQARALADRAVKHLASVGATLMGVVFNRAQPGDFRRAISSASVRSVPNQGGPGPMDARSLPALGPMARTVARQARQPDNPHAE